VVAAPLRGRDRSFPLIWRGTGFSQWKKLFPSESSAIATVDRLVDRATILRFTGKSFRNPELISGAPLEDDNA
jgi:hypothetical protein